MIYNKLKQLKRYRVYHIRDPETTIDVVLAYTWNQARVRVCKQKGIKIIHGVQATRC